LNLNEWKKFHFMGHSMDMAEFIDLMHVKHHNMLLQHAGC